MVYLLGKEGAERHDDGCGLINSQCAIWKTEKAANKITNLGKIINSIIVDDFAVPFHIRMATFGIEVTKENAHPFLGEYFVLMHNGTLLPIDGEEPKDKKRDSDSLEFLRCLDSERKKNPKEKFEDHFNKAMENFAGKFAFIIREIKTKKDYIVRGRTADLYISNIKKDGKLIGYVINTSNITLRDALLEFENIASIHTGCSFEFSQPVLLSAETIFLAGLHSIEKVGSAKENTVVKKIEKEEPADSRARSLVPVTRPFHSSDREKMPASLEKIMRLATRYYDFLSEHSLTLLDLQVMFKLMGGISLLEASSKDLAFFSDHMIPKISTSKKFRKKVKSILNDGPFPYDFYKAYPFFEYPWMLNDEDKLIRTLSEFLGK